MPLQRNEGIDATMDLVLDPDTFLKRLTELKAAAKESVDAAKKSAAMNKTLFAERDDNLARHQAAVESAKAQAKAAFQSIQVDIAAVKEERGTVERLLKSQNNIIRKIEQDQEINVNARAAIVEAQDALAVRVEQFKSSVREACKAALS